MCTGVDTEYNVSGLQPQVNEHSKPGVGHGEAGAGWPSKAGEAPVRSYTEIDRSQATAHVEEVPITESRDYSEPDILYDLTKDGFDDDTVDTFSVPVSVAFNVPEAETTTTAAVQEQTTAEAEAETSTVSEVQETTTSQAREAVTSTTARLEEAELTTTEQEEAATTASPAPATTERLTTTYSRLYSLINRNRNSILAGGHLVHAARDTTTARGEVYLGTRPTPAPATTAAPTTLVIDLTKSAHKVPSSLWSSFERSREVTTTTTTETATEMSYNTPDTTNNNTGTSTNIVLELPKPSEHESELLVEKQVTSLDTEKERSSGFVPRRKISSKNKEKWIKDWVSRKFNKPKFPRGPLLPFAPSLHKSQVDNCC